MSPDAQLDNPIDVINDCDDQTYYAVCFSFIFALLVGSINIDDLTLIFGMIAAFSESTLNFVFPGLFFIIGTVYFRHSGRQQKRVKFLDLISLIPVVIFVSIGVAYFFVSNYFNFLKFQTAMS